MGCIRAIIRLTVLFLIIAGFIYFGGASFIKEKFYEYTNPPRSELIDEEKDFGNLNEIPQNFKLTRTISIGQYKKLTATDIATGSKINLIDTGKSDVINQYDFYNKQVDLKIEKLLNTFKDSFFAPDNVEITQRGTIFAKGKVIPFVDFNAGLKNIPFVSLSGTLAAYSTTNRSDDAFSKIENMISNRNKTTTKIVFSIAPSNKYHPDVVKKLIKSISFK